MRPSSRAVGDLLGAHEGLLNSSQNFSLNGISQKSVSQQNLTKMFLTMKSLSKKGREGSPSLPRASQPPDPTKAFESSSSSCNSSTPSSPQVVHLTFVLYFPDPRDECYNMIHDTFLQVIVTSNTPPWTARPGMSSSSSRGVGQHFRFPEPVTPVASRLARTLALTS